MKSFTFRLIAVLLVVGFGLVLGLPVPRQAHSQTPTTIESDAASVTRTGGWTSQSAAGASGGRYLYSSGAQADVLTLQFTGPSIEVVYVAGPSLGTLAINVDDTVLRTVITTSDKTAYQQSSRINYLSNQTHTLKVYAQKGGVVAIDAFIIPLASATTAAVPAAGTTSGETRSSTCAPVNAIARASVTSTGGQSSADAFRASISSDGRYVAFESVASLVPGDGDAISDIYVYDRQTCTVELVSIRTGGQKGNGGSNDASISADGRYIAYDSSATNLIASDTNGLNDIFVYDRNTATTSRVNVFTGGTQAIGGDSYFAKISGNGRFVTFFSLATNLVAGDSNGQGDIFVHDRNTITTTRVNVATGGAQANSFSNNTSISSDGRYVAFDSAATNLVAGDTNGLQDVFVHDRNTATTTRVSIATGGAQEVGGGATYPAISSDGRFVTFQSFATNLVAGDTNGIPDIFVHDRNTATTTRVNVATGGAQATGGGSFVPTISGDGRYVAYESDATNLVAGDTNVRRDIFVFDRNTTTTTRVSVASNGTQANSFSNNAAISSDGRYVAFETDSNTLVAGDSNGVYDIYVAPRVRPAADTLALFNPTFDQVNLLNTLADNPPISAYTAFSAYANISNGQWVMGDWNGDGLKTPGVYNNGPFYYTNKAGESQPSDWSALWIGIAGPPIAGRFNAGLANDCIGAVQAASFPPYGLAFVFYFTCDLSGNTAPAISFQWLSAVLPDSSGFSGTHQFGAGDFNGDGVDSIAVRRGTYVAFGNVPPTTNAAAFDLAQFIGAPSANDAGSFVVGNWDGDLFDSFGLFYQNGEFFFRNDLTFNSGAYGNQSVGTPFGNAGVQVASWH